ncbi:MAG: hypothetical protein GX806_03825, partial [Lentisphaerae bacterium]|nr:hypothetical protein [Lentisphaerota bacterium]
MEHAQSSQLGTDRNFSNANELEKAAEASCASQTLLLCGTARLARRLLHRWRQQQQQAATSAWLTPAIHSLKGWVYQSYAELWPAARPLTPELSLQLWHMAAQQAVPPTGLNLEPSLYRQMQFSLEALLNEKLDPLASQSEQPLARFRQRATQHFLNLLPQYQAALWSDILKEVCAAIESQGLQLPKQTIYI